MPILYFKCFIVNKNDMRFIFLVQWNNYEIMKLIIMKLIRLKHLVKIIVIAFYCKMLKKLSIICVETSRQYCNDKQKYNNRIFILKILRTAEISSITIKTKTEEKYILKDVIYHVSSCASLIFLYSIRRQSCAIKMSVAYIATINRILSATTLAAHVNFHRICIYIHCISFRNHIIKKYKNHTRGVTYIFHARESDYRLSQLMKCIKHTNRFA